jgi:carboxyl-terminal processing protease
MPKNNVWKVLVTLPVALSFTLGGTGRISSDEALASGTKDAHPQYLAQLPVKHAAAKSVDPERLYHRVWALIRDEFFDQPKFCYADSLVGGKGQDWTRWQHKYDGHLQTLDDSHKAIETMLASLGDRYTRFLDHDAFDDEKGQIAATLYGVGIQIGMDKTHKVVVIAPIDNTPASKAGLMSGDEIAEINGKPTKGLSVEDAAKQIKGPKGTEVTLGIVRSAKPLKFTMKRDEIHIASVQTAKMITPDIGYIRLTSFISQDANKEMLKALSDLSGAKGIILDLRDNPGGLLTNAIEISNMFLDGRRDIVSTVDKDGYKTPAVSDGRPVTKQQLIVLINKGSASASEITSGALHDNQRAMLIGETSFGKGLVQGITRLEDETGVNVTIARYLTPNDTDINKKGIAPDVSVALNEKDYKEGRGPWWADPEGPTVKRTPDDLKDIQLKKAVGVLEDKLKGNGTVIGATPKADTNSPVSK